MKYADFLRIAEYGNVNWKGSFTKEEVEQNAKDYYAEWEYSQKQGKATHTMEELCKLLIDDIEGKSEESLNFLNGILDESTWAVGVFYCNNCGKREIAFFSEEEIDNLHKHANRQMLIQDAIPDKPQWVREIFVSGMCKCPKCWKEYWNGDFGQM